MAPAPPVIEGALKNTLNAIGFGLITTTLVVNFGRLFVTNFFMWIMVIVVLIEILLLAVTKKRKDYEVYETPGRKGRHTIEGAGNPQITVQPPDDEAYDSPKKKHGIRERLKKDKVGKRGSKVGLEAGDGVENKNVDPVIYLPKLSPNIESKAKDAEAKAEKKQEKAEKKLEKAEEKAQEKAKGKEGDKGKETDGEECGKEKSKSKSWKSRLQRKSQGESD